MSIIRARSDRKNICGVGRAWGDAVQPHLEKSTTCSLAPLDNEAGIRQLRSATLPLIGRLVGRGAAGKALQTLRAWGFMAVPSARIASGFPGLLDGEDSEEGCSPGTSMMRSPFPTPEALRVELFCSSLPLCTRRCCACGVPVSTSSSAFTFSTVSFASMLRVTSWSLSVVTIIMIILSKNDSDARLLDVLRSPAIEEPWIVARDFGLAFSRQEEGEPKRVGGPWRVLLGDQRTRLTGVLNRMTSSTNGLSHEEERALQVRDVPAAGGSRPRAERRLSAVGDVTMIEPSRSAWHRAAALARAPRLFLAAVQQPPF